MKCMSTFHERRVIATSPEDWTINEDCALVVLVFMAL